MRIRFVRLLSVAFTTLWVGTVPAAAQITTGTVTGTIKDTTGGVIPGATVVLISEARGTRSVPAVTNATGNGLGPGDPGSDSVTASISYRMSVVTPLLWPLTGTSYPVTVSSFQRAEY